MATDLIESCTKEEQVNVACEEVKGIAVRDNIQENYDLESRSLTGKECRNGE